MSFISCIMQFLMQFMVFQELHNTGQCHASFLKNVSLEIRILVFARSRLTKNLYKI